MPATQQKPENPHLDKVAFQIEMLLGPDGTPRFRFIHPEDVLGGQVRTEDELHQLLRHWQHNEINFHTESTDERRWHIERERPALRWFCRKFSAPVPPWLQGNGGYDEVSFATHEKLFGKEPLRVQEFKTWRELQQITKGSKP